MSERALRLLIVTYVFPPFAAVGGYRILKFCKYLPEFGITPVILTPRNPNTMARDEGLMEYVPGCIPVYHSYSFEPFRGKTRAGTAATTTPSHSSIPAVQRTESSSPHRRFKRFVKRQLCIPDSIRFWSWTGLWQGVRAMRFEEIDAVLSSSPPHSSHILASRLAALFHKPHIVDFRDLWTQNTSYVEKNYSPMLRARDRRYEEQVLRKSAGITVNTDTFKQQLLAKNAFLSESHIEVVTNGVDPDDFKEFVSSGTNERRFTLLYTGSLYGGHRNPEFFFATMKEWLKRRPDISGQVRLMFVGNWAAEHTGLIERHGLGDTIVKRDWMPQREALKETFAADLLLLFQGFDPALAAAIPRKLFEYMITNKPIMAFAPPGEIPQLIEQYDCGKTFSSPEPGPIIEYLDTCFNTWKHRQETGQTDHSLRSMPHLETRHQIGKLASMCIELVQTHGK